MSDTTQFTHSRSHGEITEIAHTHRRSYTARARALLADISIFRQLGQNKWRRDKDRKNNEKKQLCLYGILTNKLCQFESVAQLTIQSSMKYIYIATHSIGAPRKRSNDDAERPPNDQ